MEAASTARCSTGIGFTQVGDPRAHCQERVLHAASSERLAGSAGGAESLSEDEEVADLGLCISEVGEGW